MNETLSPAEWIEIAQEVSDKISSSLNRLVDQSDAFAYMLFTGTCKPFVFHCLQAYIGACQNRRFIAGIEYIFEL